MVVMLFSSSYSADSLIKDPEIDIAIERFCIVIDKQIVIMLH